MKWICVLLLALTGMQAMASPAEGNADWKALGASTWIAEGAKTPERTVYVFTDTECPYCHKLWASMRPYLGPDSKVQVRYVVVAVINEDSEPRATAILSAKNPAAELTRHEQTYAQGGIAKATVARADISAKLDSNMELMVQFGLRGTPSIIYLDATGNPQRVQGNPSPTALASILGK
jgi:thiol:disulfide interchange protein DsbG